MHDLAIIIVSHGDEQWLPACLSSVQAAADGLTLDVVVVDNLPDGGARELIEQRFPWARALTCDNHGFAHANNVALATCQARLVLFLNPDTEVVAGTLAELVAAIDGAPRVGLVGVRQTQADRRTLHPTIRRFPSALRTLCEVLGAERLPWPWAPLGERDLRLARYDREVACDWTSGSFMLARGQALAEVGPMDERFFIFAEEVDLCLRIRQAGWQIRHLPTMTIVHQAGRSGISPRRNAQDMYSRVLYAGKHFSPGHRLAYRLVLALRQLTRLARPGDDDETARLRRQASLWGLRVLAGRAGSPYAQASSGAASPRRPG